MARKRERIGRLMYLHNIFLRLLDTITELTKYILELCKARILDLCKKNLISASTPIYVLILTVSSDVYTGQFSMSFEI